MKKLLQTSFKTMFIFGLLTQSWAYAISKPVSCDETLGMGSNHSDLRLNDFRETIGDAHFNQGRTINEVYNSNRELRGLLKDLPPGSVVVDLGGGHGITVASAVYGHQVVPPSKRTTESIVSQEQIDEVKHLRFLSITATPENQMAVPTLDPNHRYRILPGRLFEDIPDTELQTYVAGRHVVAFSETGVFSYTPTPDIALEKIHKLMQVGDKLLVSNVFHGIQTSTGQVLSFGEYATLCGFKIHSGYLEKTAEPFHRHPLIKMAEAGGRPPTFFFRIQSTEMTPAEKVSLDLQALSSAMNPDLSYHTDQAGQSAIDYFVRDLLTAEALDPEFSPHELDLLKRGKITEVAHKLEMGQNFENSLQGFSVEAIEQLSPGATSKIFSFWTALDLPREALRFIKSHPLLSKFNHAKYQVFFEALTDILEQKTQSKSFTELIKIINSIQSDSFVRSGENLDLQMLASAITQGKVLEFNRNQQVYLSQEEKTQLNGAVKQLAMAWAHSSMAQKWAIDHHLYHD